MIGDGQCPWLSTRARVVVVRRESRTKSSVYAVQLGFTGTLNMGASATVDLTLLSHANTVHSGRPRLFSTLR